MIRILIVCFHSKIILAGLQIRVRIEKLFSLNVEWDVKIQTKQKDEGADDSCCEWGKRV